MTGGGPGRFQQQSVGPTGRALRRGQTGQAVLSDLTTSRECFPRGEIFELIKTQVMMNYSFFVPNKQRILIMTHNENNNSITEAVQAILENGLEGMGTA